MGIYFKFLNPKGNVIIGREIILNSMLHLYMLPVIYTLPTQQNLRLFFLR